ETLHAGHRIWVSLILDFLASGETIQSVLENYPGLVEADIYACIAYGAEDVTPKCTISSKG
ncbi:MAG TPA: DUF433 domain-containing protein, partial [Leptospiraceae bacterium]|nr:DUF433 domain-containing protein [Leptospiraceae bacterium]